MSNTLQHAPRSPGPPAWTVLLLVIGLVCIVQSGRSRRSQDSMNAAYDNLWASCTNMEAELSDQNTNRFFLNSYQLRIDNSGQVIISNRPGGQVIVNGVRVQ